MSAFDYLRVLPLGFVAFNSCVVLFRVICLGVLRGVVCFEGGWSAREFLVGVLWVCVCLSLCLYVSVYLSVSVSLSFSHSLTFFLPSLYLFLSLYLSLLLHIVISFSLSFSFSSPLPHLSLSVSVSEYEAGREDPNGSC